jgi:predicted amidophosphoribosyltransferase
MNSHCKGCGNSISDQTRFCGNCGTLADLTLEYKDPFQSKELRFIFAYYGAVLLLCLIVKNIDFFDGLNGTLISDLFYFHNHFRCNF